MRAHKYRRSQPCHAPKPARASLLEGACPWDEECSRDCNERFALDAVGRSVQNSFLACGIGEPECGRKRLAAEEPTRRARKLSGPGVELRDSPITLKRIGFRHLCQ